MQVRFFLIVALIFAAFSTVAAQYTIPDCAVAQVNAITNTVGGDWLASRDQFYQQLSGEWNAATAGLTAAQVVAYTQVYCGSLVITDGGIVQTPEGEVWNLTWSYLTVDTWLSQGGGQTNVGGQSSGANQTGSGSTPNTLSGSGGGIVEGSATGANVSSASLDGTGGEGVDLSGSSTGGLSGAYIGGGAPASEQSAPTVGNAQPQTESTNPEPISGTIFASEFTAQVPPELTFNDANGNPVVPEINHSDSNGVLRIKTDDYNVLYYTAGASLVDYQLEAEVIVRSGDVLLAARSAGDFCSGYYFRIAPDIDTVYLQRFEPDCSASVLAEANGVGLTFGEALRLRFEVNGQQLTAFLNDTELLSAVDATYSAGYPLLYVMAVEGSGDDALVDVSSFWILGSAGESTSSAELAPTGGLFNYAGSDSDIITALQERGTVPSTSGSFIGGGQSFLLEELGTWYEPLALDTPHTNVVIGGALKGDFRGSQAYEVCTLMARVVKDNDGAVEELAAGLDSNGDVVLYDSSDPNNRRFTTYEYKQLNGSLDDVYYFVLVAMNDHATLFVNGQPYFENIRVEARQGTYGVGVVSGDDESSCRANDVWVYSFD